PLDRDAPTGQARWHLTVTATDGQYTASTDVVVNLKDVNDNVPVFPHDVIDAHVLENSLAGTCSVTVNIDDVNDVPPSFVQSHVEVSVPEYRQPSYDDSSSHGISSSNRASSSHDASSSSVILSPIEETFPNGGSSSSAMFSSNVEFSASKSRSNFSENFITTLVVADPDESNVFAYRVVPRSGFGWQLVEVRAGAAGADLFSRVPLDFENPQHRAGLNFRVQVTDQVRRNVVHGSSLC
ncbi:putative neural-cadherin 2, partial [Hyalella azteca]|uniref:Neural-cadherin 2 n=1 Tax=Hyalella azteca TaxID=294128 RepID=A0A979FG48_HYAAZ